MPSFVGTYQIFQTTFYLYIYNLLNPSVAQLAGAIEYTDCISAEG